MKIYADDEGRNFLKRSYTLLDYIASPPREKQLSENSNLRNGADPLADGQCFYFQERDIHKIHETYVSTKNPPQLPQSKPQISYADIINLFQTIRTLT